MLIFQISGGESFLGEIIGGVVSGILAIIATILLILFLKQRKKQQLDNSEMPRQDIESEKIPLTEESQEQKVSLLESSTAKVEDETGNEEADCDDEAELVKASRLVNHQISLLEQTPSIEKKVSIPCKSFPYI